MVQHREREKVGDRSERNRRSLKKIKMKKMQLEIKIQKWTPLFFFVLGGFSKQKKKNRGNEREIKCGSEALNNESLQQRKFRL